ncbi:metallophosphoesterase [Brucepastera parasyntrophica]|uniref:metallophosphoesterase n=1 Tax=Brucepastera parasyntrophica TaxID=2880008 RepID=UPI002108E2B2|nr:metallophosphoesterase [Brucepastera parasyntrophica]ULQ59533.1 metallophosphoesterase [Brucepastera parasyntrophica]
MDTVRQQISSIYSRSAIPDGTQYMDLAGKTAEILRSEDERLRPQDRGGESGGLLLLGAIISDIPTIIVPDLHARMEFITALLDYCPEEESVLSSLSGNSIRIVFLGDGFHSERRGIKRWNRAYREFLAGNILSPGMHDEMRESLGLMEMVMVLKCSFPQQVHFLKGNHENIKNEEGGGNHPFYKFADEGEMVRDYILEQYGPEFLDTYSMFEKALPLCAIGERFMASHAEPRFFYDEKKLVNCRFFPEVVEGLTWTGNDEAEPGSVQRMLEYYLPGVADSLYFGGHRTVDACYALRAEDRFVQIHDPNAYRIAIVPSDRSFDLKTDIRSVR